MERSIFVLLAVVVGVAVTSPARVRRQTVVYDNDFQWLGAWGKCSKNCGNGQTKRQFEQTDPADKNSILAGSFTASCNMQSCGTAIDFGAWGTCTKTCGGGTRRRLSKDGNFFQDIECNTQPCKTVDGCGKADVFFVLDSSGSVGELSWSSVKQFVIDVITNLKIASDETRVAAITFSTDVEINIGLTDFNTKAKLTDAIWNLPYKAGATNTAEAFFKLRSSVMTTGKGDRKDVKDVVFVVTDGASNIFPAYTIKEAERVKALGAEVFAIGVTNKINSTELKMIASNPKSKHVYELVDFNAFKKITKVIVEGACVVPVDGKWTDWGVWSECSADCTKTHKRTCTNPAPENAGKDCVGKDSESVTCTGGQCPVDGEWTDWGVWSKCSAACKKERTRTCTNPAPVNGGKDCVGLDTEIGSCTDGKCPVDGKWTDWGVWTECSAVCKKERTRTCTDPSPKNGGKVCAGLGIETEVCNGGKCPVDGKWTDWGVWSACRADCSKERVRSCTNPAPANGGKECAGLATESLPCNEGKCVIDGGFTDWGKWSVCKADCTRERARSCTNPAPKNGGKECGIDNVETEVCSGGLCVVEGGWTDWGKWTECSVDCKKERTRACTNPAPANGGKVCGGDSVEAVECSDGKCPAAVDCAKCHFINGLGYLDDPKDCAMYFQCQKTSTGYTYHHRACAPGTLWRQGYQTCVHPIFAKCAGPANVRTAPPTTTPAPTTAQPAGVCESYGSKFQAVAGKPSHYMWIWASGQQIMPCAATLVWSQEKCACVVGTAPAVPVCDQDLMLYYPFDEDVEDHSCTRAKSTRVGQVTLIGGKRNKAAYFNGACRIEVPRMMNAFADQKVQHFSIALWFKNMETVDVLAGLVNNGGCTSDPTFAVYAKNHESVSGGYHTSGVTVLDAFTGVTASAETWHHLAMTYDGTSVKLYLDGSEEKTVLRTGFILNNQCPMNIGYQGLDKTTGFFKGYIDELRVYKKTLTNTEISSLMKLN